MVACAEGVSNTGWGTSDGMGYVVNVGSGVGAGSITGKVDTGSIGSGVITCNGAAEGVESMFGSFITSTVCIACGAGTAVTSVIIGVSVAADVDGAASIT